MAEKYVFHRSQAEDHGRLPHNIHEQPCKKGYVKRERSEKDRRVVFIQLTNKGRMAYHHHAEFHRQMTEAVLAELNEDETEVLVKALDGLRKFFRQYHEQ